MAYSKVILNGNTIMDVTQDTVAANNLLSGETATGADGQKVQGAYVPASAVVDSLTITPTKSQQVFTGENIELHQSFSFSSSGSQNFTTALTVGSKYYATVQYSFDEGRTYTTAYDNFFECEATEISLTTYLHITSTTVRMSSNQFDRVKVQINDASSVDGYLPVTVNGDANFVAGNIKKDVSIWGITGTYEGSGGGVAKKQIQFIDYDGTVVESYTTAEFSELTALPNNPSHTGLVAQGWNWTLAQIQNYLADYPNGDVNVGQMYDTASGKTEIDIVLDDPDFLSPYLAICPNGTVTIDWGDNSTPDTVTGTSYTTLKYTQHVYSAIGSYTISIDGPMGFYSTNTSYGALLTNATSLSSSNYYSSCITEIRVNGAARIGAYAFSNCRGLQSITIPIGVTNLGSSAFSWCISLKSVTFPIGVTGLGSTFSLCFQLQSVSLSGGTTILQSDVFKDCRNLQNITIPRGVTAIGNSAFNGCGALRNITIPRGITAIGSSAFSYCYSAKSITIPRGITTIGNNAFSYGGLAGSVVIPDSVTSIGTYAFSSCYSVMEYHLLPTTPPTLANTNAFSGIVAGTKIYVPAGCLEAYQTAANWSTYASYMVEEAA